MSDYISRNGNVIISESTYANTHDDFKGVWEVERWDIDGWEDIRSKYMGKRTWMPPCSLFGYTCLLVEGCTLMIVSDEEYEQLKAREQ